MYIMVQVQSKTAPLGSTGETLHEAAIEMLRDYIRRIEIPVQRQRRVIGPKIIMPVYKEVVRERPDDQRFVPPSD